MLTCRPACTWNGGSPRAGDGRDGMFLRVAAGLLHHHGTEVAAIFFASLWKLPCFLEMMMFKDGSSAKTRATLGKKMVYLPDFAAFEIFEVDQAMFFSFLVDGIHFWWIPCRPTQEQQAAQPAPDGLSRRQGFFQAEP